ncbi:MAG: hypothetical protein QF466_08255 [Desulfobacterales bacterium]|jgi:hypothetical protein|nr:hypothetical protein [Desulfobacterales bacterium]|tara:strand:- start:45278 stop:45406 length:129 start_codon:yes stop_codon:yes gene_type:complete
MDKKIHYDAYSGITEEYTLLQTMVEKVSLLKFADSTITGVHP